MTMAVKKITSRANDHVKYICDLHDSKGRGIHNEFIAEGTRTCTTLIKNGMKLTQFYVTDNNLAAAQELTSDFFITVVSTSVMEKISTADTPSGMLGVFKIPAAPALSALGAGLVLASISDPGNMGTLIRTAAALQIKNVVICEGVDVWNPKVIRATAGYIAQVQIFTVSWQALVTWKKELRLCALVVKGGKAPKELSFENSLLVVGNEATGIPAPWLRDCNYYLTIPMPGNTDSLNAAVAGSLALYLAFTR